jgi:hypothetical protein
VKNPTRECWGIQVMGRFSNYRGLYPKNGIPQLFKEHKQALEEIGPCRDIYRPVRVRIILTRKRRNHETIHS